MKTSKEPETEIQGNRHVKIERQNNNKYKEDRDVFDNQSVFGSLAIAYSYGYIGKNLRPNSLLRKRREGHGGDKSS